MTEYSLLVTTSDGYSTLVPGFIELLARHWKGTLPKIYIVGETKLLNKSNTPIEVSTIMAGKCNWSTQIFIALNQITSDYVIMLMEDCYITDFVDTQQINKIANYAYVNNLDYVDLIYSKEHDRPEFLIYDKNHKPFLIRAAFGMWKREFLIKFLRKNETAWDFELMGSFRLKFIKMNMAMVYGNSLFDVFPEGIIAKGKLNPNFNFDELKSSFGIQLDWTDIDVTNVVTTHTVPKYIRAYRKILRIIKTLANVFFNDFKSLN